jgi:hypothetical protein
MQLKKNSQSEPSARLAADGIDSRYIDRVYMA